MDIHFAAVGRMRRGPEATLFNDYRTRIERQGRALGISRVHLTEAAESRAASAELRRQEEAGRLLASVPPEAVAIALDRRGEALTSEALAKAVKDWIEAGPGALAVLVGGPDGHGSAVLDSCTRALSLGPMTWPHLLARAMIAEQLYRALTIIAGHPYHRG